MSLYVCPICKKTLREEGNGFSCESGHQFDRARSGYVHLLPVTKKKTKFPGDNKLMANARKEFLNKGYYEPLADSLADLCEELHLSKGAAVLDAGCGEGYYTSFLEERLHRLAPDITGIDISKFTIDLAAKRNKNVSFAVASSFDLPVCSEGFDLVLNLFAPFCREETLRVLKKDGYFVMVIPGEDHLWELKEKIYDTPYKNQVKDYPIDGFEFVRMKKSRFTLNLPNTEDIMSLFAMTPYYYKTSREDQEKVEHLTNLTVTADVELLLYRKSSK